MLDHARGFNDVQVTNTTDDVACISIAGPLSRNVLAKLTSEDVSNKGFRFMKCKKMKVAGVPVLALRVSYTGEDLCFYLGLSVIKPFVCELQMNRVSKLNQLDYLFHPPSKFISANRVTS